MRLPDRVDQVMLGDGYAATEGTLRALVALVDQQHKDPRIRARMRAITAGLPSTDYDAEIAAVWDFVTGNIRYLRDPLGAEHITDPLELDREIDAGDGTAQEDCESLALYAATLFASAGYRSAFVIIGRDAAQPDRFSHCYLIVQNPRTKRWINFDPVAAWNNPRLGLGDTAWRPGDPYEVWGLDGKKIDMPIVQSGSFLTADSNDIMSQFLGELIGDAQADARKVADATATGLTSAGGPWGALFGGIIKAGEGIFDIVADANKPKPSPADQAAAEKALAEKKQAEAKAAAAAAAKKPDWLMWGAIAVGGVLLAKAVLR